MKEREDDYRRVRLSEFIHRFDVQYGGGEIQLSEGNAFRSARGAGSVEEE